MVTETGALEASKAVNDLLHYCPEDQEALLELLDDYFTSPADLESSDDEQDTIEARGTIVE